MTTPSPRKPEDWFKSWEGQFAKRIFAGMIKSRSESTFDFNTGSWLVDYGTIQKLFGKQGCYLNYG